LESKKKELKLERLFKTYSKAGEWGISTVEPSYRMGEEENGIKLIKTGVFK